MRKFLRAIESVPVVTTPKAVAACVSGWSGVANILEYSGRLLGVDVSDTECAVRPFNGRVMHFRAKKHEIAGTRAQRVSTITRQYRQT